LLRVTSRFTELNLNRLTFVGQEGTSDAGGEIIYDPILVITRKVPIADKHYRVFMPSQIAIRRIQHIGVSYGFAGLEVSQHGSVNMIGTNHL
jgi:hypothetical protein